MQSAVAGEATSLAAADGTLPAAAEAARERQVLLEEARPVEQEDYPAAPLQSIGSGAPLATEAAESARKAEEERLAAEAAGAARKVEEARLASEAAGAARKAEEERLAAKAAASAAPPADSAAGAAPAATSAVRPKAKPETSAAAPAATEFVDPGLAATEVENPVQLPTVSSPSGGRSRTSTWSGGDAASPGTGFELAGFGAFLLSTLGSLEGAKRGPRERGV